MLSVHAHNLAQYVGKGRQLTAHGMHGVLALTSTLQHAGYVLYRALVIQVFYGKLQPLGTFTMIRRMIAK